MAPPDPTTSTAESCVNYLRGLTPESAPADVMESAPADFPSDRAARITVWSDTFDPTSKWVEIPNYLNPVNHRASWARGGASTYTKETR